MNTNKVEKYIERRIRETGIDIPTLEELNGFLGEWMQMSNSRPLENFEGYSPFEMQLILHDLLGESCPVQLTDFTEEVCESVPLFGQVKMVLEIIEKERDLKLTQTGNLPPRIVKAVYCIGAVHPHIERGIIKLRTEKDSISVQMVRIALELLKAVKKRHNRLSLTKTGKELLKDDSKLLSELLRVMFREFNSAYFDYYSSENIGVLGLGFNVILLSKYGNGAEKDTFYFDKYIKAFPMLEGEMTAEYDMWQKKGALDCYSYRLFNVLLYHLGVVTIEEVDKYMPTHIKMIGKTELFDKLFKIQPPKMK